MSVFWLNTQWECAQKQAKKKASSSTMADKHPATDHHRKAAEHHTKAAEHHTKAAESTESGKLEEAGMHAHHAQGHHAQAGEHMNEAAKKTVAHHESTEKSKGSSTSSKK